MKTKKVVLIILTLICILFGALLAIYLFTKYSKDEYLLEDTLSIRKQESMQRVSSMIDKVEADDIKSFEIIVKFAPNQMESFSETYASQLQMLKSLNNDLYIFSTKNVDTIEVYKSLINDINQDSRVIYSEPNYKLEYQRDDSIYYFNSENKFSLKYPSYLSPCCGIAGPIVGNPKELIVLGDSKRTNQSEFKILALHIVNDYPGSLDDYVNNEKNAWLSRIAEMGNPGLEQQELQMSISNKVGISLKGFFSDNFERNYIQLNSSGDILVITLGYLDTEERNEILDTLRFDINSPELAASNDPLLVSQWYLDNSNDIDINATESWALEGDNQVLIALIDAFPSTAHEDLQGIYWENSDEIQGNGIDDDANGYIDDVFGCSFHIDYTHLCYNTLPKDEGSANEGHGTISAGIIAGNRDNGEGIAGICSNCKIMIDTVNLMFAEDATAGVAQFIQAINYATNNGARVINASWGMSFYSESLQESINHATSNGSLVVAAAGNTGSDNDVYPAIMDNVLSVSAIDIEGKKTEFSSYGYSTDIAAPGESITSTNYNFFSTPGYPGYSLKLLGTSFAAPQVTAVAGLLLTKNSDLLPSELEYIIKSTSKPLTSNEYIGEGILDAYAAMRVPYVPDIKLDITSPNSGGIVNDQLSILGTVSDPVFKSYTILSAPGIYPKEWVNIYKSVSEINNGELLSNYDVSSWEYGVHTIKIVAEDETGDKMERLIRVIKSD